MPYHSRTWRWLVSILVLALVAGPIWAKKKKGGSEPTSVPQLGGLSLADLNHRIVALEAIEAYQLTTSQLEALAKAAADVKPPSQKIADPGSSPELTQYRAAAIELCQALEKRAPDEGKLDELKGTVDSLAEKAKYEYPLAPEPAAPAQRAATAFAAGLTARQIAVSLSLYADQVTDPAELAVRAAQSKKAAQAQNQWPATRDGTANEVAYLATGWDSAAAKTIADRISAWLDSCPETEVSPTEAQRAALEDGARKAVGTVEAWLVLQRWVDRDVARLLCNPQLRSAIQIRLAMEE